MDILLGGHLQITKIVIHRWMFLIGVKLPPLNMPYIHLLHFHHRSLPSILSSTHLSIQKKITKKTRDFLIQKAAITRKYGQPIATIITKLLRSNYVGAMSSLKTDHRVRVPNMFHNFMFTSLMLDNSCYMYLIPLVWRAAQTPQLQG